MILAAGLSPAWQQIVVLGSLAVGEVNRARDVRWCASGKVLNVGLALHCLTFSPPLSKGGQGGSPGGTRSSNLQSDPSTAPGDHGIPSSSMGEPHQPPPNPPLRRGGTEGSPEFASTRTLALLGGLSGDAVRREFQDFGVAARWIASRTATRVCTTVLDRGTGTTTEFVENAGAIAQNELEEFRNAYFDEAAASDIVVLTGSLPAGAPETLYRDLLERTPGRVILDTQGGPLLAALERRPFVVKPNREELGKTLGVSIETDADLHAATCELCRRGASWVVVTHGKERVWIASKSHTYSVEPPQVEVVNPIGSGDCLAAGIAVALARGDDLPDAVVNGVAAAAENVPQLFPARLDRARVEVLRARIKMLP